MAGGSRLPYYGSGAAASRRGGAWDQPQKRTFGTWNPGGQEIWDFVYLCLYLTIGPFFAIPRCATVSYTVGIEGLISGEGGKLFLAVFSLAFFAVVLFFSLRPGEIMTWIGKVMNPLFLAFLAVLVIRALSSLWEK